MPKKDNNKVLSVNTYQGVKLIKNKSFEMMFDTTENCQKFYAKLDELNKEAKRVIENGSAHIGHEFKKYQNVITLEPQEEDHLKCAECKDYLKGKILTGIFCIDCNRHAKLNNCVKIIIVFDRHYHKSCFEMDQDDYDDSQNFLVDSDASDLGRTTLAVIIVNIFP